MPSHTHTHTQDYMIIWQSSNRKKISHKHSHIYTCICGEIHSVHANNTTHIDCMKLPFSVCTIHIRPLSVSVCNMYKWNRWQRYRLRRPYIRNDWMHLALPKFPFPMILSANESKCPYFYVLYIQLVKITYNKKYKKKYTYVVGWETFRFLYGS